MGIIGKIIGGTIGFAIGGPLGAIAGAAFGHAYDSIKVESKKFSNYSRTSLDDRSQATFFVAAFSMLGKLAKVDGRVSKEEIDSIEKFMLYDLGLNPQSRHAAIGIFKTAVRSGQTFEGFATQFYNYFRHQPQLLELMIDILFRVAVADGDISPKEDELINSAVNIFRFTDEEYRRIRSKYIKDVDRYYSVLKCDRNVSNEDLKKMYRKLVAEYHPDKIASKGLPAEFTKFANNKFRQIREAYEILKKERGIK